MAVPAEIFNFGSDGLGGEDGNTDDVFDELQKQRLSDARLKFYARIVIGTGLALLLGVQNYQVFHMVWTAYWANKLEAVQPVLMVIVPATLIETAAIVHTMVRWIFAEIDYTRHK